MMIFMEGTRAIMPSERVGRGALVKVRVRFDRRAPIVGNGVYSFTQPTTIGFTRAGQLKVLSDKLLAANMQSAKVMWLEYPTTDGTASSGFALPSNTRSVAALTYRACGKKAPAPSL